MPLQVVFSFEENDNSSLADLFNVFVKVNVGHDISYAEYHAFLQAIQKTNQKYVPINTLIRTDGVLESVNLEDILFIEVFHHTVVIHCNDQIIETHGNLAKMEERLREYGFVRTHRHYLVPINKIHQITREDIIIPNNTTLRIGRTYQKKFREITRERIL